jgi:hypothetical protein
MSGYDDNWSRNSDRVGREWTTVREPGRGEAPEKRARGNYLLILALLVIFSTLGVVTINLLGYRLL